MGEPTEDIPYTTPDFATPEPDQKPTDPDRSNKRVLVQVSKELAKDIQLHTGFDSLNLPANATPEQKIAAFDEMAIHKGLVLHLRKYKIMIDNKIKEL